MYLLCMYMIMIIIIMILKLNVGEECIGWCCSIHMAHLPGILFEALEVEVL